MRLDLPEYEAVKSIAVNFDDSVRDENGMLVIGDFGSIPIGTRFYRTGILEKSKFEEIAEKFIVADTGKIIWHLYLGSDTMIDFFSDAPKKTSQGAEKRILGWFRRVG